ncbi:MAG TPA: DUF4886 domain-containing protein [Firmicutes bacterium]|nr:DUF4886 domain-containing protein [Bacillota bacterium]
MMRKISKRAIAYILAAVFVLQSIPLMALLALGASEPVNLFQTALESSRGVSMSVGTGNVQESQYFNAALSLVVDGDSIKDQPVQDGTEWSPAWYIGAEFTLDGLYEADTLTLYSGYEALPDEYRVYASDSLDTLYEEENLLSDGTACNGEAADVAVGKTIRYVAILIGGSTDGTARPKEFQLWSSGDASQEFVSENLLRTALDSAKSVSMNAATGAVQDSNRYTAASLATVTDGQTDAHCDVTVSDGWYSGALFILDGTYYVDKAVIYAGLDKMPETYRVYASSTLEDLYTEANMAEDGLVCENNSQEAVIGKEVRYLAVFTTAWTGNARPKEFELWSGEKPEGPVIENLFRRDDGSDAIASSHGLLMDVATGTATENNDRFTPEKIAAMHDGDTTNHVDVYGALDWSPAKYVGAFFELDDTYYADRLVIYSDYDNLPSTYRVYASESLEDLYSEGNLLVDNLSCGDAAQTVEIGKDVRYVALIALTYNGNLRPKEFELYGGKMEEEPDDFVPENLLQTAVESSRGITMNIASGQTKEKDSITAEMGKLVDGNTTEKIDLPTSAEWLYGVEYTLDSTYYVDRLTLYSALENLPDTYRVYASDSLANLYSESSIVANDLRVEFDAEEEVILGRRIRYLAIVGLATEGNTRPKEFQLWSGEDTEEPPVEDAGKKVLTIGNSFSENASIFATEIAAAQGYDLTFAYLKYPSCTLDQHWENAQNNNAVYKFALTDADGRNTVKDGATTFATIEEALTYADWDIVVLQQGSTVSTDYGSYSNLGNLIGYVREYCPDVEIMLHETWSWDNWPEEDFDKIEAAYHRAAEENGGLTVIHSGRAFEFAREALDDRTILNEDDHQHANSYGQYVAGASYVATIFGCDLRENTFGDGHPYFADIDMDVLRQAVMDAVSYVPEEPEGPDTPGVEWPEAPEGDNLFADAEATPILADDGNYAGSKEYGYTFVDGSEPADLSALADGDIQKHYDVYGFDSADRPGVLYDLGAYYDITHIRGWAGIADSKDYRVYGYRVYASELREDLFKDESLVFQYSDAEDTTSMFAYEPEQGTLSKIRYIAVFVTDSTDGGWRLREFAAYGSLSEDQTGPSGPEGPDEPDVPDVEWPEAPDGGNLFADAEAAPILAPEGNFANSAYYLYTFVNGADPADLSVLADGDTKTHYDAYGFGSADRPGVLYDLGAYYDISHIRGWAGIADSEDYRVYGYRVYASELRADLFKDESLVFQYSNAEDTTGMFAYEPEQGTLGKIRYIAVFVTDSTDGGWRLREFAAYGSLSADQTGPAEPEDPDVPEQPEVNPDAYVHDWPAAPSGDNLLAGATATTILAPGGDFAGGKEQQYSFMNGQNAADLSVLTDGDLTMHYDAYGFGENDKPGILYDLGGYYDISHIRGWAGIYDEDISDLVRTYYNYGYRVYASDNLADLYKAESLVFNYSDVNDISSMFATNVNLQRVRYIAVFVTDSTDGGWRLREFAAYGTLSADQTEPEIPTSIIEGIDAEYYGVATDDLADPIYAGASAEVGALTDGKRDSVEFWGGSDTENAKFVFIYDLYANYDLTGAAIYAFADSIDMDYNVHKGIASATIYASRTFEDLFSDANGVTVKDGYEYPDRADETSFYEAQPLDSWKMARYVAFVFTIDDSAYGACRLEELQVYGTLSAEQDEEVEAPRLPQYIDLDGDHGVVLRLFQKNSTDDLAALGARLLVTMSQEEADLNSVAQMLDGKFDASRLYEVSLVNADGQEIPLDGRVVRLSFPAEEAAYEWQIACVDDYGAEIISNGELNGAYTVETETLRSYAPVREAAAVDDAAPPSSPVLSTVLWAVAIALGVFAVGGAAFMAVAIVKRRKG